MLFSRISNEARDGAGCSRTHVARYCGVLALSVASLIGAQANAKTLTFDLTLETVRFWDSYAFDPTFDAPSLGIDETKDYLLNEHFQDGVIFGLRLGDTASVVLELTKTTPENCTLYRGDECAILESMTVNDRAMVLAGLNWQRAKVSLSGDGDNVDFAIVDANYLPQYTLRTRNSPSGRGALFYTDLGFSFSSYENGMLVGFSDMDVLFSLSNFRSIPAPVPLPATGWMLLGAVAGAGIWVRRRRQLV